MINNFLYPNFGSPLVQFDFMHLFYIGPFLPNMLLDKLLQITSMMVLAVKLDRSPRLMVGVKENHTSYGLNFGNDFSLLLVYKLQ